MGVISSTKFKLRAAVGSVVARLALSDLLHRGKVLILAYHRVLPGERLAEHAVEPGMYVTDSTFSHHLEFLKAHYDILSMQEWLTSWSNGGLHPRGRYCLITFDDGWRDNYDFAFPILRHFRVPATIFLATAFIGTKDWFWTEKITYLLMRGDLRRLTRGSLINSAAMGSILDPIRELMSENRTVSDAGYRAERVSRTIHILKEYSLPRINEVCEHLTHELAMALPQSRVCLDWTEIQEMSTRGVSFGSHSCTHEILTQMPPSLVHTELAESKRILESRRVHFTPVFCYPNGTSNPNIQYLVQQAQYHAAMTTQFGSEPLQPKNRFGIRRIALHQDIAKTNSLLALRLMGATGFRTKPTTEIACKGN